MKRYFMMANVLLALIPTILIGFSVNYYLVTTIKAEKMDVMAETANMMRMHLGGYYDRLITELQSKAENDEFLKVLSPTDCNCAKAPKVLQETRRILLAPAAFPILGGAVIDPSGKVILSTDLEEEGLMLNQTELYQQMKGGSPSYNGMLSDLGSMDSAEVAVPIVREKKFVGILKQDVDLKLLYEYLGEMNPVHSSVAFLVRKNGDLIYDESKLELSLLYHEYQNRSTLEQLIGDYKRGLSTEQKGFVEFENNGAEYLGAYEIIPSINCIAVVAIDRREMFGDLFHLRTLLIVSIFIVLLTIAAIGYWIGGKHVSILRRINQPLQAILKGDLSARCEEVKGSLELRNLCRNLNHLADNYQKKEKELRMSYRVDSLTYLPNRNSIYEMLDTLLYKSPNQALLILDLEGFNEVNDNLGNDIGDKVLIEVGDVLRKLPQHVCYPSRLGGAEFLIFVTNWTAPRYPERIAEKIISQIGEIRFVDEVHVNFSVSVGVAYTDKERIDKKKLIKYANIAMCKARTLGKNTWYVHYPYMQK